MITINLTKSTLPYERIDESHQGLHSQDSDSELQSVGNPGTFRMFKKTLKHTVTLHPSSFGDDIRAKVMDRLYAETQGSVGANGYIVCVVDILKISQGSLLPSDPNAHYDVEYRAVSFKPVKNQVTNAIVSTVNKMGFFAEVGPMQIFVSSHLIPPYHKFDQSTNSYVSSLAEIESRIEKGVAVRIRIIGTRVDASEIFAIGTIKEDFLGPNDMR